MNLYFNVLSYLDLMLKNKLIFIVLLASTLVITSAFYLKTKSDFEKVLIITISTDKPEYFVTQKVNFVLTIKNKGLNPIMLNFSTSQRYDFVILKGKNKIWVWSRDKVFLQVLGSEILEPGEAKSYSETWTPTETGDYTLIGIVTSRTIYQSQTFFKVISG